MLELKRLMDEYKARINDPTYVAPKELRTGKSNASAMIDSKARPEMYDSSVNGPTTQSDMHNYAKMLEYAYQKRSDVNTNSEVNGDNSPFQFSGADRQALAQSLGIGWRDNQPELGDDNVVELHKAIDRSTEVKSGSELNEREKMFLDLMTDWRGPNAK